MRRALIVLAAFVAGAELEHFLVKRRPKPPMLTVEHCHLDGLAEPAAIRVDKDGNVTLSHLHIKRRFEDILEGVFS